MMNRKENLSIYKEPIPKVYNLILTKIAISGTKAKKLNNEQKHFA